MADTFVYRDIIYIAGARRHIETFIFRYGGARDTYSEAWMKTKSDWLKMNVVIIIFVINELRNKIYTMCTDGCFQMGKVK